MAKTLATVARKSQRFVLHTRGRAAALAPAPFGPPAALRSSGSEGVAEGGGESLELGGKLGIEGS